MRMIWAACCLCFFDFLMIEEITTPSIAEFNPVDHLCISDIAMDSQQNPSLLRVPIKRSKMDPFRKEISHFLGRTKADICPMTAVVGYLKKRGTDKGVLFKFNNGHLLTRTKFVEVRAGLRKAGINNSKYCSHSFRIGAATTAAKVGIEPEIEIED